MKYSRIIGTGSYLPEKIMTNEDWEKKVDTSAEWIYERTGIKQRHIANHTETASYMGAEAAKKALDACGKTSQDIDMIVVSTAASDKLFPSTACFIQKSLGITHNCTAFDVQAACSGFIYALSVADKFIKTGEVKRALVVGTEVMSRLINWSDRSTCVLFGDGAGCVILEASEKPGILSTHLYADGNQDKLLAADNIQLADHSGLSRDTEITSNASLPISDFYPYIQMEGRKVFKVAVTRLGQLVEEIKEKHQLTEHDIDWLVPHQANIRIIKAAADKLGVPLDKVVLTVEKHSNTSSASIPLALDTAVRDGRIKPGQTLLLEAFGAGLTWGSALIKYI
tara:strand:- start:232340 stop:233356 length:1017 start_codon:yes stop_codon:yes gene_type:complete